LLYRRGGVRGHHRRMKCLPSVLPVLLAVPSLGFTDCQYFQQVPVPASDTQPPIVGTRMWVDGAESIRPGDSLTYSTTGDVVVAPFVFDSGGAWTLSLQHQVITIRCHNYDLDPEETQVTQIFLIDKFDQQLPGSPGQLRSNGIYNLSDITDLSSYADYCYSGFDLQSITYGWEVAGRDYKSNQASSAHAIIYTP